MADDTFEYRELVKAHAQKAWNANRAIPIKLNSQASETLIGQQIKRVAELEEKLKEATALLHNTGVYLSENCFNHYMNSNLPSELYEFMHSEVIKKLPEKIVK